MKKIWVIEQGIYSDHHVVGVYSSKANAERVCEKINANLGYGDAAEIEEWTLDPAISEINAGMKQYEIQMGYDGSVKRVASDELDAYCLVGGLSVWERSKADAWKGEPVSDLVNGTVWAKDEQHAIKIANEYRVRAIAEDRMHKRE